MTISPPDIYIQDTGTAKGRGAYAGRRFEAGEVVECCPVILFHGKVSAVPGEVRRLLFNWGVLASMPSTHCLPLGYGSMYNHDNPASMRYEADEAKGLLRFVAVRNIAANEELTVNYNAEAGGHVAEQDNWFVGMGVERVGS